MYKIIGCIFCIFCMIVFQSSSNALKSQKSDNFFAGRTPYGVPLEEWAKQWWQWDVTLHNYTKEEFGIDPNTQKYKCIKGTSPDGKMIFLINPYNIVDYVTECEISSNSSILVPVITGEADKEACNNNSDIKELWKCAIKSDEVLANWDVTLDNRTLFKKSGGEAVNLHLKDEILVRNSTIFTLNIPEKNPLGVTNAGPVTAVVDGYYLILKPLQPGMHTLKFSYLQVPLAGAGPDKPSHGDATYAFKVK